MMAQAAARVGWVDTAKGICIIFVVMMHSTLGVGVAVDGEGWMHHVVSFAQPFRMPDFFLISGLFLGLVIDRPWLRYVDRKVVHFFYFYALWLTIQFAFKAPGMVAEDGGGAALQAYLWAYVQPFGTLWFVYILPIFFIVTRLLRSVPVWLVLVVASVLEMLPIHTGAVLIDEFCARFVYFYAGYALAAHIFRLADWTLYNRVAAMLLLAVWALVNGWLVFSPVPASLAAYLPANAADSLSFLPILSLALGGAGAMAIIAISALVSQAPWTRWLTWLGAHSIVIYLAFFLPMAMSRVVLIRTGLVTDIGTISLLVTIFGVVGPVIFYGLVQWSGRGRFLFERPDWAYVDRAPARPQLAGNPSG